MISRGVSGRSLVDNKSINNMSTISNKRIEKNLDFVSDRTLVDIYSKYKTLKVRNNNIMNEFYDDLFKIHELKNHLNIQEKSLNKAKAFEKESDHIIKYIQSKTKKSASEVLMNKTDGFRLKKEMTNTIESQKNFNEKMGKNIWITSLRRPDEFKGTRYTHVNVGKDNNPSWAVIRETQPEISHKEHVRDPQSVSHKYIQNLSRTMSTMQTFNHSNGISGMASSYDDIGKFQDLTVCF